MGLFRELAPAMLEKKDRGRDADLAARPAEYGATVLKDRIEVRRRKASGECWGFSQGCGAAAWIRISLYNSLMTDAAS